MGTSGTLTNLRWDQFTVLESDLDYLANQLLEQEEPKTLEALAFELTNHRVERLTARMKDSLSQGRIYRPGESYELGETLLFPHLNNLVGEVIGARAGRNPEYDPFSVIRVQMQDGSEREFAAELSQPHPLNTASYLPDEDLTPERVYADYGPSINASLDRALTMARQFATVGGKWFVRDLVTEVSPGQINIAEAVLDMAGGGPLDTSSLMKEIDLSSDAPEQLRRFSVEYALLHDERFDEVGPAGQVVWYLRDMEPSGVLETPPMLRYDRIPYNRQVLDEVMLALEVQAADEWSEYAVPENEREEVTIVLSYPHLRSGTLPLAPHVAGLFPTALISDRIRFTFVDAGTGDTFPGWVVRSGRYVYGLADFFERNEVIVGAYVDLAPGEEPGQIRIGVRRIRSQRREWLRTVTYDDQNLLFEVTRVPVRCEFDELAAVAVDNPDEIDAVRSQFDRAPLESLLDRIFGGLAGLSLQRAVHAMTLYSVLNLVRRVSPAPMLATLAQSPRYVSLGDNYWAYQGGE